MTHMSEQESASEVARLLRQIALEMEAARNGMYGLSSGGARHLFITRKLERMGDLHVQLQEMVGEAQAIELLAQAWEEA